VLRFTLSAATRNALPMLGHKQPCPRNLCEAHHRCHRRVILNLHIAGLEAVASEMALHVLAYNLTRVMNMIGVQPLLSAMRA
jgi:hypothetical protein